MIFNYHIVDKFAETGQVGFVWGADSGLPAGITNLAYMSSDVVRLPLAWLVANHPDWIEYACDRTTIPYQWVTDNVPVDFENPAVQVWMLAQAQLRADEGYSGVGFDNVWLYNGWGRCGHYSLGGQWVQEYSGGLYDASYLGGVLAWADAMHRGFALITRTGLLSEGHRPTGSQRFLFAINYGAAPAVSLAAQQQLIASVDVWLNECSFTGCAGDRSLGTEWATEKRLIDGFTGCYISNNEMRDTSDASLRQWVIANYLLLNQSCMYLAIEGIQQYGSLLHFPEYDWSVGPALGPAVLESDGCWTRRFSNLTVTVDPIHGTATLVPVSTLLSAASPSPR